MQETMNNLARRLKKNKFYQIVFSIGKRVSKNELPNKEKGECLEFAFVTGYSEGYMVLF